MGVTPGAERTEPARRRRLPPDSPDYPAALRRGFPGGRPVPVTAWGSLDALGGRLLGFFCLLRGSARVVLCPARGLGVMRLSPSRKAALADGRLLILSFFDDALRRPTAAVAAERNARVAALADRLLVAHAEPGGKTERLGRDALARGQRVFTLDSPDNAHLAALGAEPVSAQDPRPLLANGTGSSA